MNVQAFAQLLDYQFDAIKNKCLFNKDINSLSPKVPRSGSETLTLDYALSMMLGQVNEICRFFEDQAFSRGRRSTPYIQTNNPPDTRGDGPKKPPESRGDGPKKPPDSPGGRPKPSKIPIMTSRSQQTSPKDSPTKFRTPQNSPTKKPQTSKIPVSTTRSQQTSPFVSPPPIYTQNDQNYLQVPPNSPSPLEMRQVPNYNRAPFLQYFANPNPNPNRSESYTPFTWENNFSDIDKMYWELHRMNLVPSGGDYDSELVELFLTIIPKDEDRDIWIPACFYAAMNPDIIDLLSQDISPSVGELNNETLNDLVNRQLPKRRGMTDYLNASGRLDANLDEETLLRMRAAAVLVALKLKDVLEEQS